MNYAFRSLLVTLPIVLAPFAAFAEDKLGIRETPDAIVITRGYSSVLAYHKAIVPPPEGADPAYARSGFIHPVHSPRGTVVTGIHPKDHFHHLGLWHAWVKCKIDGEEVDFWNLKKKTGAVRYAKTFELIANKDSAGFSVYQEHVVFPGDPEKESVILREKFTVLARLVDGAYEIDYDSAQTNVSKHVLELPAYRYGGPIAYRAPHHWDQTNSDYLSSEGKTRIDGHTTRSKWIAMWGPPETGPGHATLAILCHRDNHDFPQRMRVWPPNTNNGAIFFNYVPIQETEYAIEPGQTSTMRYRLVVTDAKPDAKELDARWDEYNDPK